MGVDPTLVERIYEAAALPERWPGVLQAISDNVGAMGGVLVRYAPQGSASVASSGFEKYFADYVEQGWLDDRTLIEPLLTERYPGFRSMTDYRTETQIAQLPVHREFFEPRGLSAGNGTLFQGARDDALQVAFHGFATHSAATAAVEPLDAIRGALGRALTLSAHLDARADGAAVETLQLAGIAAAVVARDGRLRVSNERFAARLSASIDTHAGRLRFADRFVQAQLDTALSTLGRAAGVRSVAAKARDDRPPFALHILPLRRGARDVFETDGVLVLLAEAGNASVPGADLLRLLFDLTPAEARLTRLMVEGRTSAEAAVVLGITEHTARTHLRRVFAKTGVTRQAELMRLLVGIENLPTRTTAYRKGVI